jgi:hypothetical protein
MITGMATGFSALARRDHAVRVRPFEPSPMSYQAMVISHTCPQVIKPHMSTGVPWQVFRLCPLFDTHNVRCLTPLISVAYTHSYPLFITP